MLIVIGYKHIDPSGVPQFLVELKDLATIIRQRPGNLPYAVHPRGWDSSCHRQFRSQPQAGGRRPSNHCELALYAGRR